MVKNRVNTVAEAERRKVYALTELGRAVLGEQVRRLESWSVTRGRCCRQLFFAALSGVFLAILAINLYSLAALARRIAVLRRPV